MVLDPESPDRVECAAARFRELHADRGMTVSDARESVRDPLLQAALMVRDGEAEGLRGGIGSNYGRCRPSRPEWYWDGRGYRHAQFFVLHGP
jgi:phosphotransacetylase